MKLRTIQEGEFIDKKVLLRADFNVAIENGKAKEKYKIQACKDSVDFLTKHSGCKIALTSHFGRPEGKVNKEFSLEQIKGELENILGLNVIFVEDCIGKKVEDALENLKYNEILLLENVRFHSGEEENSEEFSKKLAAPFDVFVNDAFAVCHRDQASVTGVAKFLDSYAGFWLQKEIDNLNKALHEPQRPAVAVIGGAKIETKLPLIKRFEGIYDRVLVGGKVVNEAIEQGIEFSPKVVLAVDFAEDKLDIGERTIQRFKEVLSQAKMIVWNGPMGKFEQPPFDRGTREVLDVIIETDAFTLIGGGESVQILEERGLMDKVSFVSTGGGAMLEYLSGNPMPGIESLKY